MMRSLTLRSVPLFLIVSALLFTSACSNSPTSPSNDSRIIQLGGTLNFGDVPVGTSRDATFTIHNAGKSVLTFTALQAPCISGISSYTGNPTSGTVAPGGTITVSVRFTPISAANCSGTLTVVADHTSGVNTIPITARGTLDSTPIFSMSGVGDNVFKLPSYVTRVRVDGSFGGSCQNFIVHANGSGLVNVIIGTCSVADTKSPFTGTYVVTGGAQIEIVSSTGVSWTFTEVR